MSEKIYKFIYDNHHLPFNLLINFSEKYIISVEFLLNGTISDCDDINFSLPKNLQNGIWQNIVQQLDNYVADYNFAFDLPLNIVGTEFQQKVWREISLIKSGHTASYKELAWQINSSPRAVANACGANKFALIIPCHRVVASNMGLGGFMRGNLPAALEIKQWLLAHESPISK